MKKLLFTSVLLFLQINNSNAQNTSNYLPKVSLETIEWSVKLSSQEQLDNQQKIAQFEIIGEIKNAFFKRKMKAKRKYKSNLLPLNFAENSLRNLIC